MYKNLLFIRSIKLIIGQIKVNISNNIFDEAGEIHGFSKDEILEIKKMLGKLKTEDKEGVEINKYVKTKLNLSSGLLDQFSTYLNEIKKFSERYLLSPTSFGYYYLKKEILYLEGWKK